MIRTRFPVTHCSMRRTSFPVELDLIRKIAWSFHHTTGLPFDDLYSEAALAYVTSFETYDPTKSALSTWTWTYMQNALINYVKAEQRYNTTRLEHTQQDLIDNSFEHKQRFQALIAELSTHARTIFQLIQENPHEFLSVSPRKARGKIIKLIRNELGWSWPIIWSTFRELKTILKEPL